MKFLVLVLLCIFELSNAQVIWVRGSHGDRPAGALSGGNLQGQPVFVCRTTHNGDRLAGYLDTLLGTCNFGWGGRQHTSRTYDVATGAIHFWIPHVRGSSVPRTATLVGFTLLLERTYVCRTRHFSMELSGKVIGSRGTCYIGQGGLEHSYASSNVLADGLPL